MTWLFLSFDEFIAFIKNKKLLKNQSLDMSLKYFLSNHGHINSQKEFLENNVQLYYKICIFRWIWTVG